MDHSIVPQHILAMLELYHGEQEYRDYILKVLNDSRDGQRLGFPYPVAKYLILQLAAHDAEFPQFIPKPKPWEIA